MAGQGRGGNPTSSPIQRATPVQFGGDPPAQAMKQGAQQPTLFQAGYGGTVIAAKSPDPPARKRGPDTSKAAARMMRTKAPTLRQRVHELLRSRGGAGATNEEITEALGARLVSITPRVRELALAGTVRDSGQRRRTSSGASAIVWTVAEACR